MDPSEALRIADQAISDCDPDRAADALLNYAEWRRAGGFEPVDVAGSALAGDKFEAQVAKRLETARVQLGGARRNYDIVLRVSRPGWVARDATWTVLGFSLYEAIQTAQAVARGGGCEVLGLVSTRAV